MSTTAARSGETDDQRHNREHQARAGRRARDSDALADQESPGQQEAGQKDGQQAEN